VLRAHDIKISMDGKGRWVDNVFVERLWKSVKCEPVYLHSYESVDEARRQLRRGAISRSTIPTVLTHRWVAGRRTRHTFGRPQTQCAA